MPHILLVDDEEPLRASLSYSQSDELDRLALELNRMSERLASLDRERRVFLANVSHELRTRLSNVLVTVEALRSGAATDPRVSDRQTNYRSPWW